jgi:PAS domain S-box-containing protein
MMNNSLILDVISILISELSYPTNEQEISNKISPFFIEKLKNSGCALLKKNNTEYISLCDSSFLEDNHAIGKDVQQQLIELLNDSTKKWVVIDTDSNQNYGFKLVGFGLLILRREYPFKASFIEELLLVINLLQLALVQVNQGDISDEAKSSIGKERDLLRTVIDAIPIPINVKDNESRRILSNKAELKKLDLRTEKEVLGKLDSEIHTLPKPTDESNRSKYASNSKSNSLKFELNTEKHSVNMANEESWTLNSNIPMIDKLGDTNSVLNLSIDITERKKLEVEISRKQKILLGIALATDELLTNPNLAVGIDKCLSILGATVGVDRTYVYENTAFKNAENTCSLKYEWSSQNIHGLIKDKRFQKMPMSIFDSFLSDLWNKEPLVVNVSDLELNSNFSKWFLSETAKSVLLIPVFKQDEIWGLIGYEDCSNERVWSDDELLLLKNFSNSLSSALVISDSRKALRSMALFTLDNPDPVVRIDRFGSVLIENKPAELLNKELAQKSKNLYVLLSKNINRENPTEGFEVSAGNRFYRATARLSETEEYTNVYFSDITKQREIEQDIIETNNIIRAQEEKYRNIISNMNLGLLEIDTDGLIQFCNQTFTTMSGFELTEIKEEPLKEQFFWNSFWGSIFNNSESSVGQRSISIEILTKNKRGEAKWWLISSAENTNDKGERIGSIGIFLDITRQKALEKELEKALKSSTEASKAKELFLANMSHEIRTPLHGIIGVIREMNKSKLDAVQKGYVTSATKASRHLLSVVNNILDITKIETGELNLDPVHFSSIELLSDVHTILNSQAESKNIEFLVELDENVPKTYFSDEARIRQILINLAGNAIKFTSKGYVKIHAFISEKSNHVLSFEISDTGIGIESQYINKVFEKFQQEDSSITRKFGGTGLGLFVTKNLVDLLGGEISIQSAKGQGTKVLVSLPIPLGDEQLVKASLNIAQSVSFDNAKILLVEDNDMNRLVASYALNDFNVNVTEAENGLKAVELLKEHTYDIILMDIQMPEMNGMEATKVIRNELKIETPIIALSANAFKSEIDKCLEIGMNDYVTKPFEEHELIGVLAKYCSAKKRPAQKVLNSTNGVPTSELYDLKKLREMSRGNEAFVIKMLELFTTRFPAYLEEFEGFLKKNDFDAINKLAHKIKPSINDMGIYSIKQDILDLERFKLSESSMDEFHQLLNKVTKVLSAVVADIHENHLPK